MKRHNMASNHSSSLRNSDQEMGRTPSSGSKNGFNRGAWTSLEDKLLTDYVSIHGEGKWTNASKKTGLKRCGKNCRLRWLNYLRPDIKRGNISRDEEELIVRLHKLLGNRWSLIAGRLPGRTDNEIKNYWNSNLAKKIQEFQHSLPKLPNTNDNNKQLLATAAPPPTSTPVVLQVPHESYGEDDQKIEASDQEATWPSSGDDHEINANDFLIDFNMEDLSRILDAPDQHETGTNINGDQLINGSDLMMSLVPNNFFDSQLLDWSGMS